MGVVSCCSREWNVLCFGVSPGWPLPQEICSWPWAGPAPQMQNVQTAGPLQGPACFWFPARSPVREGAVRLLAVNAPARGLLVNSEVTNKEFYKLFHSRIIYVPFSQAFPALLVSIYALRTIQNEIQPACETGPDFVGKWGKTPPPPFSCVARRGGCQPTPGRTLLARLLRGLPTNKV